MSFVQGLTARLTQGIDQRIADRRAEQMQQRQFQTQMDQKRQMLPMELERRQAFKDQDVANRPAELAWEIEKQRTLLKAKHELEDGLLKLSAVDNPEFTELLKSGNNQDALIMAQRDPKLMRAYDKWMETVGNVAAEYKKKEFEFQQKQKLQESETAGRVRVEQERQKTAGIRAKGGGSKTKLSRERTEQARQLRRVIDKVQDDLLRAKMSNEERARGELKLRDLQVQLEAILSGTAEDPTITEEEKQQARKTRGGLTEPADAASAVPIPEAQGGITARDRIDRIRAERSSSKPDQKTMTKSAMGANIEKLEKLLEKLLEKTQ